MIRAIIVVSGKRLGMSYMSIVSTAARDLKINGKVKKLSTGGIGIACECNSETDLESFVKLINRKDAMAEVDKVEVLEKAQIEKPQFTWFYVDH